MSEPTYTITITETERTALARSLGMLVTKLTSAPVFVEAPSGGTAAARAVLSPADQRRMGQQKNDPAMANSAQLSPPAVASPAPIEQRDRWARNKKGVEVPNPAGCETQKVNLWKVVPADVNGKRRMKVSWYAPAGQKGFVDAACWDEQLFPWLTKCAIEGDAPTILYTVRSGNYLNVVGVRA